MQNQRTAVSAPRVPRTDLERAAMEEPMRHLAKLAKLTSRRTPPGGNEPVVQDNATRRAIDKTHREMRAGTLTTWPPEITAANVRSAILAKLGGRAGCSPATTAETRLLAGLLTA